MQGGSISPTLTVSIVNWNAGELIIKCIDSVYNTIKKHSFEVVVVDNNSTDGSIQEVEKKFPYVHIIKNDTNVGYARAHNQVLKSTKSSYVLLLNPDCLLTNGAVDDMLDYLTGNPQVGLAGPKVVSRDGSLHKTVVDFPNMKTEFQRMLKAYFPPFGDRLSKLLSTQANKVAKSHGRPTCVNSTVSGPFLLINKSMLDDIGYLDEDFFLFSEENDICWRAKQKGWKRVYFPDKIVYHFLGESRKKAPLEFSVYHMHRSRLIFFKKHYGRKSFILLGLIYFFIGLHALCVCKAKKLIHLSFSRSQRTVDYSAIYIAVIRSAFDVFFESSFSSSL